ncbi:hypothetical protein M011DRAFT_397237 [Sporormia fimetaria CBS 119925]|uniref:MARVEL domain-containing protein n=1 Tax=Sporormia fimetaria CBS 119925 TaxID=1340428 RepID=A0A6A6VL40_9PLEO|nr:hypothetical protein M011DRAFT_397237 [Sporormia fimetaria CBS 119925]
MSIELPRDNRPCLSSARSALRLLNIVFSAAVAGTLIHTLEIYRSNISLDLRHGELPMTWPARTNLAPTLILFIVAASNFVASVAIMAMSAKRSFRRPIRTRDAYRILAGSLVVVLWVSAISGFQWIDAKSKASLGHYACGNRNVLSNGRFQYRAVCTEQGLAFYLAIGAALVEAATLCTLAITALQAKKDRESIITLNEKGALDPSFEKRYP